MTGRPSTLPAQAGTADLGDTTSLDEELLQLIARGVWRSSASIFFSAAVLAVAAYKNVPWWAVTSWLASVTVIALLRRVLIQRLAAEIATPASQRLKSVAKFALLGGASFGASILFWPHFGDLERAVASMVILGLCAGSVATNLGYLPIFLSFFISSAGPLCLAWLIGPSTTHDAWVRASIAALIALFGWVLTMLARDSFRLFADSFEARRQQAASNRQLREALAEAEAANRAKTRFLASASHDLRQPLHTVSLFSAALSMRQLDARTCQLVELMNTAVQSLGVQLDALLDISKLDAGVVAVHRTRFELDRFLARIGAQFAPQAASQGLRLTIDCTPHLACDTDEALLGRIVANLVDNAIKYTASGGVSIRGWLQDEQVRLSVSDTGMGIAHAEQTKVFEEFYQVDNPERDRTRGLGLGLSIVARTAQLLGLPLQLSSKVPGGSTFTLTLAPAGAPVAEPPAGLPDEASLAGLRALVIDDEEAVRGGMLALLEGWGCDVVAVADTAAALEAARAHAPDILLVDFRLRANDDGIAAIRSLRALCPDVPALLISGDTAPARLREAHGARLRMLHKPVPAPVLRRAIRLELAASRARATPRERVVGAASSVGSRP